MDINLFNHTKTSSTFLTPTIIWCLLMPLIHFFSLLSNILCIIVFCSKIFIHKPIAIYFICLLISDSTTLLIGYSEMLDRESSMVNRSSLLCMFNEKIIHSITELIYTFMGKFCLEWMLYKVLWTRASTILLAILSIQRSRTFLSLSYHETRFCAVIACICSILMALVITCLEWIGVQCERSTDLLIYQEIFQSIIRKNSSKEFYSNFLVNQYEQSIEKYYCIIQAFDIQSLNYTRQLNCSTTRISSEFYSLTQSLLSNHDIHISESLTNILLNTYDNTTSLLTAHAYQAKSIDIVIKLFEKRPCHITLMYTIYLKFFDFLHSISFAFNRHTLAIFFGNALPSFLVVLANLLSLKVIYFSKNLRYLKQTTRQNRRHRRLQNDLRALLVILIESFSVITISWGIPIFLTMYYCQTLYVVSMSACPQIQKSLAFFLFTDLFNSSTNCLLYSLSGKLFRRKFLSIIQMIFTCGRSLSWHGKRHSLQSQQMELQASNDPSVNYNYGTHSRNGSYRQSEVFSSMKMKQLFKNKKTSNDTASFSMGRISDEQEAEVEVGTKNCPMKKFQKPQIFKTFLIHRVQLFGSTKPIKPVRRRTTNVSYSSAGGMSQRQNQGYSSKIVLMNADNTRLLTEENVTSL